MASNKFGILAATAAASLLTTVPALAGPKIVKGHFCQTGCKGKSACGGMGNANGCSGSNTCKGKGWLKADSEAACKKAGGTWAKVPDKKKK